MSVIGNGCVATEGDLLNEPLSYTGFGAEGQFEPVFNSESSDEKIPHFARKDSYKRFVISNKVRDLSETDLLPNSPFTKLTKAPPFPILHRQPHTALCRCFTD